tara:strand:- start:1525 stop:2223 length:699 start_codon:yes stop_codon:yes gene_type:complete
MAVIKDSILVGGATFLSSVLFMELGDDGGKDFDKTWPYVATFLSGAIGYYVLNKTGITKDFDAESNNLPHAVAVLAPNDNGVKGEVRFIQEKDTLHIDYEIKGLTDGEHGFHIHEYGDLTDGCDSACSHFNPYGVEHGGLDSEVRHLGDLGNITSKDKMAKGRLSTDTISLNMGQINCIVGRMIIVHADRDDLGKGGNAESLKTGNAGKRVGCGVIGLAENTNGKKCGVKLS